MADENKIENVVGQEEKVENKTPTMSTEELIRLSEENSKKMIAEIEAKNNTRIKELETALEAEKLAKMSEKDKNEYMINKQITDSAEEKKKLLDMLEEQRKRADLLDSTIKERDFREKMMKVAAEKPWLAAKLALVKNEEQAKIFVFSEEQDLKELWEFKQAQKGAGTNAFSGYASNKVDEKKEQTAEEIISARLAAKLAEK